MGVDTKAWLRSAATENLDAASFLLGRRLVRAAANRLWYALYHACWLALHKSHVDPEDIQGAKVGRAPGSNMHWWHERLDGALMMTTESVKALSWQKWQVDELLKAVRGYRVDADYTMATVDEVKLRHRWEQAETFVKGVLE